MSKYPTLLFWPEENKSSPLSRVRRICEEYGIRFHSDPLKSYDLHFFWSYTTKRIVPGNFTLNAPEVINRGCWDIGKERVNDIFNDIRVNPLTYKGVCVEKYDAQGQHSKHRLVHCPTQPKEGYIYQRYIEDRVGELYVKYRIYYADGIEWILKQKKRTLFGHPDYNYDYVTHEWVTPSSVFNVRAMMEFNEKCRRFGFDYGDVDFVMDQGTPIIIDINNVVSHVWFTDWIKQAQDEQFIDFIQRRYDQSGKVC